MRSGSRSWIRFRSAKQIPRDEPDVGGAFGESPHEVRIPRGAVRNVQTQAIAQIDNAALQIAANSIQHLKLELFRADFALACIAESFADDRFVVSRDRRIGA